MIEMAVGYVGAYLARKSMDVLARAGSDVDAAIDDKLSELYEWVKAKLTGRPSGEASLRVLEGSPESEDQQTVVADQLAQAVAGDPEAAEHIEALVAELDKLRPPGVTIRGLARAGAVSGTQVAVDVEGELPPGTDITGEATATRIEKGGESFGVRRRL